MNNGGYSLPEQEELKEERRKQLDWNWRRGFESISTFVFLTALIVATLTFSNTPKESNIKALRLQVDSLKHVKLSTTVTPPVSGTSFKKKH
ncbi:hypothetical protein GCM10028825_54700 [Spirosoma agri]|nr:hypothetical protein [Spirosoma agri]